MFAVVRSQVEGGLAKPATSSVDDFLSNVIFAVLIHVNLELTARYVSVHVVVELLSYRDRFELFGGGLAVTVVMNDTDDCLAEVAVVAMSTDGDDDRMMISKPSARPRDVVARFQLIGRTYDKRGRTTVDFCYDVKS